MCDELYGTGGARTFQSAAGPARPNGDPGPRQLLRPHSHAGAELEELVNSYYLYRLFWAWAMGLLAFIDCRCI